MNKLKKYGNKLKIVLLCLLTISSGLIGAEVKIKGATAQLTEGRTIPQTGANLAQGTSTAWWANGIGYIYANGQIAFCVEPMTLGVTGHSYSSGDFDASTQRTLSKIVYYGWDTTAKTDNDYATTQYMIWETLGATITQWYGSFGNVYPTLKANVQAKINRHGITPSFNGANYEVDLGNSITIPDTNGVLNQFHVKSNAGANVNISGNNLVITPTIDTPDNITIVLQKELDSCVGSSIAYRSGTGQDVGLFKVSDPQMIRLNIKVNKFGSVKIAKTNDEGQTIPNTTYKLSYNSDMSNPLGEYTTQADGTIQVDDLKPQMVYIQEVKAPQNLVLNPTINAIMIVPNQVVTFSQMNKIQKGKIVAKKVDNDTSGKAQGDATLEGAKYGLYTKENIVNPITNDVLIPANTKVLERTTKTDGTMDVMENLYLGKYYFQEISASNGYILNKEKIDITLSYGNPTDETVEVSATSKETIVTGDFDLEKVITNGEQSEIVEKEEGAEFIVVLKKYVDQYGSIEEAYNHRNEFTTKEHDKLVTNEEGYDKSNPLAFGKYVVKQTKGKIDTDKYEATWEFEVSKENQKTIRYIINNRPFTSYLKVVKKDVESGKTIILDSATFKIFDVDNNKYLTQKVGDVIQDEFSTNEKGYVVLPLQLKAGNYRLEEIKAPHNYLLNTKTVDFKITNAVVGEVDKEGDPIQIIEFTDKAVKGQIEIIKNGEVLTSTKTDKRGTVHFGYTTQGIAGMECIIVADEDILDPADGSVIYTKGDIVETVTTGADGKVKSSKLPLGNYYVQEISAPSGFVINKEKQYVELKYKDQNTALISKSTSITDERQKIEIDLLKRDFDNKNPLMGAVFGLYAKEDITSVDGKTLVKAGDLIETQITNEIGTIVFEADLPLSLYEVKEIKAPIGYSSVSEVKVIDASYKGQELDVIKFTEIFDNKITKIEVSKTDITTDKELAGNHLSVYEKGNEGNVFDTWISTDKPHMIKGLEVGKTYVLHETSSAFGFAIAKDVEFTIADTGDIQKVKMENKLVEGKLVFNKYGEIFMSTDTGQTEVGAMETPVWEGSNLLGAEITLYADEDITLGNNITYFSKDEAIQTLVSDWDDVESQLLPVGKYYYVETKAPLGYVKNDERHYFTVEDNQTDKVQTITSTLKNERPLYELGFTKELEVNDIENPKAYEDVVFGVFTRDDTYNFMGSVAIKPDTLVYTSGIDDKGKLTSKFELPIGNYYIKELSTNEAYILDENEYDFTISQSNEKDVFVEINEGNPLTNELKDFKVLINKVDSQTKKNVTSKDFEFTRYADKECTKVIDKANANTKDGNAIFDDIHYGVTYIKETKAPQGYRLSDEVVKVEVKDDGVFVNDKEYSADDNDVYSIVYLNSLLPSSNVTTGDDTNLNLYLSLASVSTLGLLGLFLRRNKRKRDLK